MKSQIFNNIIPIEKLFTLFELVTTIKSNNDVSNNDVSNNDVSNNDVPNNDVSNNGLKYFIIDKTIFKKLQFNNNINNFLNNIINYYYKSKQHYITRKMNYNNFLTIVRQICNINNKKIEKKIIYSKSKYDIIYYIYI